MKSTENKLYNDIGLIMTKGSSTTLKLWDMHSSGENDEKIGVQYLCLPCLSIHNVNISFNLLSTSIKFENL